MGVVEADGGGLLGLGGAASREGQEEGCDAGRQSGRNREHEFP
jgi:hypothetical protein